MKYFKIALDKIKANLALIYSGLLAVMFLTAYLTGPHSPLPKGEDNLEDAPVVLPLEDVDVLPDLGAELGMTERMLQLVPNPKATYGIYGKSGELEGYFIVEALPSG
jgi:multisubunit Na+/H+ antiporter MnhC subunit